MSLSDAKALRSLTPKHGSAVKNMDSCFKVMGSLTEDCKDAELQGALSTRAFQHGDGLLQAL